MKEKSKLYHIGISGGKDSGAVLLWMVKESGIPHEQLRASFCDTGNEVEQTYKQVELLSEKVFPIKYLKPKFDFYELARKKNRFPSPKVRFCTQELKMKPTAAYIETLLDECDEVIGVSGVRADESLKRSNLAEWGNPMESYFGIKEWRPILKWSIVEVVAIHKKYGIPLNELYTLGAKRVGCFPCIMSRKAEIKMITEKFPERIDFLREQEYNFPNNEFHSFFASGVIPDRFCSKEVINKKGKKCFIPTIDDVAKWSKITLRNSKTKDEDNDIFVCPTTYGVCE